MIASPRSGDVPPAMPGAAQVAVVLCTRDRPRFLARALEVLAEVLPAEAELIVIDSGSATDATARIAQRGSVRYVRSDVPGLSIARNLGLAATSRDIVVYTDDDCELQPGALGALLLPFTSPRVGATTGRLSDHAAPPVAAGGAAVRVFRAPADGIDAGHGALMAYRTAVLRAIGGFDPLLGAGRAFGGAEDLDAFCRVLRAGSTVVHVPRAEVRHMFTRDDEDYAALQAAYGRGLGAMTRKWVAATGSPGRRIAWRVLRRAALGLVRHRGDARARAGRRAYVAGLREGYRRARDIPVSDLLFHDVAPPAPVRLGAPIAIAEHSPAPERGAA
ncbi:glycosyltransferase family 2 protein [Microbacterium sediminis]|uniref:Uncharacterized protein n=1 Tax=Microbacterium sediminis TaxID=904291 RepID=A0A1B9NGV0_9MICO|nr:glycosyltransferase family A protein [Microbacterium sediminis]OCG75774.1 hypothetical protein A7J15_01630 [Microbacterium sediminis]QBR74165.1 glycosyltransferase family 2 protein [Microbacterium sediminis]